MVDPLDPIMDGLRGIKGMLPKPARCMHAGVYKRVEGDPSVLLAASLTM